MKNKKACVNVKNKDNSCHRWSIKAAIFPVIHNRNRPGSYPSHYEDGLNYDGIAEPVPVSQNAKVERQNDLAINVFGWDNGVIVHYISKQPPEMQRINLLLTEKNGISHYTLIDSLNRLLYVSKQASRAKAILRALSARLHQGGPAGGTQARMPRNRPDGCEGGYAERGEEQAHLP